MSENPCIFKKVCTSCKFVTIGDRPNGCVKWSCKDYTPCKGCAENRPLDQTGRCANCGGEGVRPRAEGPPPVKQLPQETSHPVRQPLPVQAEEFTFPGHAPSRYTADERQYYDSNWVNYSGYYRDPTAAALLHNIILLEVEINHTIAAIAQHRTESKKDLEGKHDRLTKTMKILRDQLPKKESMELNEDEKSLGMIHERYLEQIGHVRVGGISRVLTQDAIALAPHLHFPINVTELLQRLGYRLVDIVTALEKHFTPEDVPKNIDDMLEFLGFYLKAKYAMPDGDSPDDVFESDLLAGDEEIDLDEISDQVAKILEAENKEPGPGGRPPNPVAPKKPFAISYDDGTSQ